MPFSRGSSGPRDQTWVSCIVGRVFTVSAIEKSLAPTLLHPSFKGRTNRKPMALVKRERELKVGAGATPVLLIVPEAARGLLQIPAPPPTVIQKS